MNINNETVVGAQAGQAAGPHGSEAFPDELAEFPHWVLWRQEAGKKPPFQPHAPRWKASVAKPATWASLADALTAYQEGRDAGLGFVLTSETGLACIDIDDLETEDAAVMARGLLVGTGCRYIEVSPSGCGLHGWGFYSGEPLPRLVGTYEGLSVEIYTSKRFLTVTGRVLPNCAGPFAELHGLHALSEALEEGTLAPHSTEEAEEENETEETEETDETDESEVGVGGPDASPQDAQMVPNAILKTYLPPAPGNRNRYAFLLAQYLKGKLPDAKVADMRSTVKRWHEMGVERGVIATKPFAETWGDFSRDWEAVKYPKGVGLARLLAGSEAIPLPDGFPVEDYGAPGATLYRVCTALQHNAGDEPFFLAARTAGEIIGIQFTRAADLLRAFVADGILEIVSVGKGRQASRYRLPVAPAAD